MKGAIFSDCCRYRYYLSRPTGHRNTASRCTFVLLNPSTADAENDDPTIRKCIKFAAREGCGLLQVVNLYALRETSPQAMLANVERDRNQGENMDWVTRAIQASGLVIVGFGAHAEPINISRFRTVATAHNWSLQCFAINQNGTPKHPLYVRDDAPLMPWAVSERAEV